MAAEPSFEQPPPGYVSAEAQSRFHLGAALIGVGAFVAQMILPTLVMLPLMYGSAGSAMFDMSMAQVDRAVAWDGRLWFYEESVQGRIRLVSLAPGDDGWERQVAPTRIDRMNSPWLRLLADGERLWLISPTQYAYFDSEPGDGVVSTLSPSRTYSRISPPFLYEGRPAVVTEPRTLSARKRQLGPNDLDDLEADASGTTDEPSTDAEDYVLWTLVDGQWQQAGTLDLEPLKRDALWWLSLDQVRVVTSGKRLHLFVRYGETLWHHSGLPFADADAETDPSADRWEEVGEIGMDWAVVDVDGEPVVLHVTDDGLSGRLLGLRRTQDGWNEFLSHPVGAVVNLGACPLPEAEGAAILVQGLTGLRVIEVRDGQVFETARQEGGLSFLNDLVRATVIANLSPIAVMLLAVFALSWLMGRYRTSDYGLGNWSESGGGPVAVHLASLGRRTVARLIDSLLVSLPLIAFAIPLMMKFDLDRLGNTEWLLRAFVWLAWSMGLGLAWLLFVTVTEGVWGYTPGKWLAGVRVVATDLRPCGIGAALVRNLLLLIDTLFIGLVGMLLIAFSRNWQRLGDLAAGTIVVRSAAAGPPAHV